MGEDRVREEGLDLELLADPSSSSSSGSDSSVGNALALRSGANEV